MKINTSQISMDASVEHKDVTGRSSELTVGRRRQQPEFQLQLPGVAGVSRERVAENRQSQQVAAASVVSDSGGEKEYEMNADQVVERMTQEITGQRIRMRKLHRLNGGENILLAEPLNPPGSQAMFSLTSHTTSYHYEKVSVHSSGSVQLADGRDISFSLDLTMEREAVVQDSIAWRAARGILMDPLVFSFDCDLRSLCEKQFYFDLNSDGEAEETFSLQPGSGFLALDLDNDGGITNGKELFGPTTGHGFEELAQHDFDANGWIDENDPIFAKLLVWKPGVVDGKELIGLAEAGIGAICLTYDQTSFQLRDQNNRLMGNVAASGFFLTEGGEVRPLQEIKLAVNSNAGNNSDAAYAAHAEEAQSFLRRMAEIRQVEVQQMARLRLSREQRVEEHDLFASLFPERQREIWLSSVEARNGGNSPS